MGQGWLWAAPELQGERWPQRTVGHTNLFGSPWGPPVCLSAHTGYFCFVGTRPSASPAGATFSCSEMSDIFIPFASQFLQIFPTLRATCICTVTVLLQGSRGRSTARGQTVKAASWGWPGGAQRWDVGRIDTQGTASAQRVRVPFLPSSVSRCPTQLSVGAKEREQEISAACRCCADKESTKSTLAIAALPPRSSCKPQAESRRCGSGGCSEMTLISINFC